MLEGQDRLTSDCSGPLDTADEFPRCSWAIGRQTGESRDLSGLGLEPGDIEQLGGCWESRHDALL
jgi:hypothetical protein